MATITMVTIVTATVTMVTIVTATITVVTIVTATATMTTIIMETFILLYTHLTLCIPVLVFPVQVCGW